MDKADGIRKTIVLTSLVMLVMFIAIAVLIFFISLKSADQVMVPHVEGKDILEAQLELQAKELYPLIQLRYSSHNEEKGIILAQKPAAGSIVKGGKRIELIVSQGSVIDTIPDYTGDRIEMVQERIHKLLTSGTRHYIRIRQPYLLKYSKEPAGTILEQQPPAGTAISNNMEMTFVISKGNEGDKVKVPNTSNMTLPALYQMMEKSALVFNFTGKKQSGAAALLAVQQSIPAMKEVPAFSPVKLVVAVPETANNGIIFGILQTILPEFPYPYTISLQAAFQNGNKEQLVTFRHPGGECSIPYAVPEGTILTITVHDKVMYTLTAGKQ